MSDDRIGLLVNRWHHSDMAPADITKLLGKPVFKAFPNDYALVREAVSAGSPVALDSRLGRAFLEFAAHLADAAVEEPKSGLAGKLKGLFGRG